MLGVGIGWLREEFDAMGVPFERRGARFDEYIEAMRKIWSPGVVEHKGEFVSWSGFQSYPLPVQDPFPVIIGGSKGKAFQRIARYGQGWFAPTPIPDQLEKELVQLAEACKAEGRDPDSVEVTTMWIPAMGLDSVARFRDLGVQRLVIPLQALGEGDPLEGKGPEDLVVIGLAPHGTRLFAVRQRGLDIEIEDRLILQEIEAPGPLGDGCPASGSLDRASRRRTRCARTG